ncbi:NAD(P)-dependent alcohol dehydrogenase [Oceanobacillus sp. CAU 1775]
MKTKEEVANVVSGECQLTTKAAVINGVNEDYQMEELKLGELHATEVLVKMVASGICQSDEGMRLGGGLAVPMPIVLGHEGAGIVEQVGSAVKGLEVDDQVVLAYDYCGACDSCRTGYPSACDDFVELNMGGGERHDGSHTFYREDGTPVSNFLKQSSFSTYTITGENNVIKVDSDVDLRKVAPLGCGLMTGYGTVANALKPETGSSIAVFGTGTVGLSALMTAVVEGCHTVVAVDIHDSRLELAKELGATHTINSKTENLEERMKEITGGKGVNYSIDTTGVSQVIKSSIEVLSKRGVSVPLAVTPNLVEFSTYMELVMGNRKIIGVSMGDVVPQIAVPKIVEYHKQGKFPFDKLNDYYKFEEINEASADSSKGVSIKPILIIDEEYRKDEPIEYKN